MVTYASKELSPSEQQEMSDNISRTILAGILWQEYVEGLDERKGV